MSSVIGHRSSVIGHPSSVIGHPSSVIRHLSSVIGHLSSVICHHLSSFFSLRPAREFAPCRCSSILRFRRGRDFASP
ncbi:MAG: hypothetical protein ACK5H0_06960 [Bacteroidota bacterium]